MASGAWSLAELEEPSRRSNVRTRESDEGRRFRTDLKDLREALTDSGLREHLGPLLVQVEKFAQEFIREPRDAERARSLFVPWIAQLVGGRPSPGGESRAASRCCSGGA